MKVVKIILFVFFVLVVLVAAGAYLFIRTFNIDQYKPQVIAAVEDAIGRDCDFKDINLNFTWQKGVAVQITDLVVKDSPFFQMGDLLRVREVNAGVDVLAYVTTRQIAVQNVAIVDPEIKIIRDKNGKLNILSLGKQGDESQRLTAVTAEPTAEGKPVEVSPAASASQPKISRSGTGPASPPLTLPQVFVNSIILTNGNITFLDRLPQTELGFEVTKLGLTVKNFSLAHPFQLQAEAAILSPQKNFASQGNLQLNLVKNEIVLKQGQVNLDLTQTVWEKLRFALAGFTTSALPASLNGQFTLEGKLLKADATGLKELKGDIHVANANLDYQNAAPGVSVTASNVNFNTKNLALDGTPFQFDFSAGLFGPTPNFSLAGQAQYDLATQRAGLTDVQLISNLAALPLSKIQSSLLALKSSPFPQELKGNLNVIIRKAALGPQGIEDVLLNATLAEGGIAMTDATAGMALDAQQLNLEIKDFTLTEKPFSFSVSGGLFASEKNVEAAGTAQLSLATHSYAFKDTQIKTDFAKLPLERIRDSVAALQKLPWPTELQGTLTTQIKSVGLVNNEVRGLLANFIWENGRIKMTEVSPGVSLAASQVKLQVYDFSLEQKPMNIVFEGGLFSETPNMYFDGTVQLDPTTQVFQLTDAHIASDLAQLPWTTIRSQITQLQTLPFPQELAGKFKAEIKELRASPTGIESALMDAQLANGKLVMPNVAPGVSLDASAINLDVKGLATDGTPFKVLLQAGFYGEQPNVSVEGLAGLKLKEQQLFLKDMKASSDLANIPWDQIKANITSLKEVRLPDAMTGKIEATIKDLQAGPKGLTVLAMDTKLSSGSVKMKEAAPGVDLDISQIQAQVQNVAIDGTPFRFLLQAAVFGDVPNLALDGTGAVNVAQADYQLKDTKFSTNLSKISLSRLQASLAALKDVALPEDIGGQLNVTINRLSASAKGLTSVVMRGDLTGGKLKIAQLSLPISPITLAFATTETEAKIEDLSLLVGEGSLKAEGTITDLLGKQNFNANVSLIGIDLVKVLEQSKQPVKVEGVVDGQYQVSGVIDPKALTSSLTGTGLLEIKQTVLKDINVLKEVLDKLTMFPKLKEKLAGNIPEKYEEVLKQKDTVLKKVRFDSQIQDGALVVNPIDIAAEGFAVSGNGKVGMDQNVDFLTAFLFADDLSAAMVKAVPEMQYLFNAQNQVQFPAKITGPLSKPKILPDFSYIMKTAIENRGKQALQSVIQKALGIETPAEGTVPAGTGPASEGSASQAPTVEGTDAGSPPVQPEVDPREKILGTILEGILGK